MMNMNEFLDQKHGKFIGRIYMLVVLFCANALIPIGAVMRFLYGGSSVLMIIGIIITVFCLIFLSTPVKLDK